MKDQKTYIDSFADCKGVSTSSPREVTNDDGFCTALVIGGIVKKEGCSTLHMKDLTDVL